MYNRLARFSRTAYIALFPLTHRSLSNMDGNGLMVAGKYATHLSFLRWKEPQKSKAAPRRVLPSSFYAASAVTAGQGSDVAGGADQPQEQEEQQQPH